MRHRGSLSAMAVCLVPTMYMVAALAIDGGRLVVAYQRASDVAAVAARDGAQEIVGILDGSAHINPPSANVVAASRMRELGYSGHARVTERTVQVTVNQRVSLPLLALIGIGHKTVSVTRSIDAVMG